MSVPLSFKKESIASAEEAKALIANHWKEVAFHKDIPLDPDYEKYKQMEESGSLRCFTARAQGKLVGYSVYFVQTHLHYKQTLYAMQDLMYIDPEYRGRGMAFLDWCDSQMKEEGVQVSMLHVKVNLDYGPALKRIGYEPIDRIYGRRLF